MLERLETMKIIKRISLFLILASLLLAAGGYAAIRAERYFYPNKYENRDFAVETYPLSGKRETSSEEEVIQTASEQLPVVTADTVYLVETVNLTDGSVVEEELSVPINYMGLNREELIRELNAFDANPPLAELEKGYETCELTAFSKDRVVVCKYYKEETPHSFYLMVADHFVVVYEEDRQTLYMNTDILVDHLDSELQAQIIQGKYIESEEALYNFLESYSS